MCPHDPSSHQKVRLCFLPFPHQTNNSTSRPLQWTSHCWTLDSTTQFFIYLLPSHTVSRRELVSFWVLSSYPTSDIDFWLLRMFDLVEYMLWIVVIKYGFLFFVCFFAGHNAIWWEASITCANVEGCQGFIYDNCIVSLSPNHWGLLDIWSIGRFISF